MIVYSRHNCDLCRLKVGDRNGSKPRPNYISVQEGQSKTVDIFSLVEGSVCVITDKYITKKQSTEIIIRLDVATLNTPLIVTAMSCSSG